MLSSGHVYQANLHTAAIHTHTCQQGSQLKTALCNNKANPCLLDPRVVGATPRGGLELWHRRHCEAKWMRHGSAPLEKAWTSSWQDSLANVKQTMNPCQKQREENMTRHISATPIQCWVMKRDHSVLHVSKYISFRQDEAKQVKTHYTSWTQRETSDFFKIKNKLSNKNNVKKKKKKKDFLDNRVI